MRHVSLTVNGVAARARPRAAGAARLRPARAARPDRDRRRLRHLVLRRLHRASRRRVGQVLHDARRPGGRPRDHDDRGARAQNGELHPLQESFHEHHALQCGYCTSGMVLAAASLLAREPEPDRATRSGTALEGNLCRCTGYQNIVDAIAGGGGDERAGRGRDRQRDRRAGPRARRTPRSCRGRRSGSTTCAPPAPSTSALVRSPYAHARIGKVDVAPALAHADVVAAWTGADLAGGVGGLAAVRVARRPRIRTRPTTGRSPRDKARYRGRRGRGRRRRDRARRGGRRRARRGRLRAAAGGRRPRGGARRRRPARPRRVRHEPLLHVDARGRRGRRGSSRRRRSP